jgi:acyl carrier protein
MDETGVAIREYILSEFMYGRADVTLDGDFPLIQEGVIDSLGIFILVSFIDERLGVKVQPDDIVLDNFGTINTISALVNRRRQENVTQA